MKVKFKISFSAEQNSKIIKKVGETQLIQEVRQKIIGLSLKEKNYFIKNLYRKEEINLLETKKLLEKIWEIIGEDYEKEVSKILNLKFQDKICYISPSINGLADVISGKSIFVNSWKKSLPGFTKRELLTYLLIHELTHLFYTDKLKELNLSLGMKSSLMEVVDHLIVFYSPINNLLPQKFRKNKVNFINKNKEFIGSLKKEWDKKKDFESFMKKAIEIDEKFLGVVIC